MTLKRKVTIGVALVYSVIYIIAAASIYLFFSSFKKEEFLSRMESKAENTLRLLVELKKKDLQVVNFFDQNMINRLYNEKTIVFNADFQPIYSSIGGTDIKDYALDLQQMRPNKEIVRSADGKEIFGKYYVIEDKEYYVFISAEDKYGKSKLQFLLILLLTSFIISTLVIWIISFYLIKRLLKPLDIFENQITAITVGNLNEPLTVSDNRDEISLLTIAFNKLLLRLKDAFEVQKYFSASASHELRTPLSRMAFQLENMLESGRFNEEQTAQLQGLKSGVYQLGELTNSLLLLSNIEARGSTEIRKPERLDEVIFSAYDKVKAHHPGFVLNFSAHVNPGEYKELEVNSVPDMLEIAFINMLKNACNYSSDRKASLRIEQSPNGKIQVLICNNGQTLNQNDIKTMFQAFSRGTNARYVLGSGLGLRIVRHILNIHDADINYQVNSKGENQFQLSFQAAA
ncbi:MAG: HAMP domain-containing histidine kinase [Bacteroidetes bacterium]|nr:HAMP domain-containing histidine kinase [Bacteroidota bacterium]